MSTSQQPPLPLVIDTNVIVDFHLGGLLSRLFELPYRFLTPDAILDELQDPAGAHVVTLGLHPQTLSGEHLLAVMGLARDHRRVSLNDLQAFVLARTLSATLLTGDGALRALAQAHGLAVHGTLWLLDEMVRLDVCTPAEAAAALRRMQHAGSRLPESECDRRLETWGTRPKNDASD